LTASQRVALLRKRKRKDIVFVGIEILPTERDALIRMGLLNKAERNDKIAVRDALYAYFEKYLDPETHRRRPDGMSAFGGKADISRTLLNVCF
jgi:hypothetical protein